LHKGSLCTLVTPIALWYIGLIRLQGKRNNGEVGQSYSVAVRSTKYVLSEVLVVINGSKSPAVQQLFCVSCVTQCL